MQDRTFPLPLRAALRLAGGLRVLGLRPGEPLLPRVVFAGADPGEALDALRAVRRPGDWPVIWSRLGERHESAGRERLAAGDRATAEESLLRAVACLRIAEYLVAAAAERTRLWRRLVAVDGLLREAMSPPTDRFAVPVDGGTIPVLIREPTGARGAPCVVTLGGVDGVKEEFHGVSRDYVRRGWVSVTLDLPGQGEPRRFDGMRWRPDAEIVLTALLDAVLARPSVDPARVAVVGGSVGGYFALRAAAHDRRIAACAVISAPVALAEVFRGAPPPIPQTMAFNLCAGSAAEARRRLVDFTVADRLGEIECPVWAVHGAADRTVPVSHADRLALGVRAPLTQVRYDDGDHMCFNHRPEWEARLRGWLTDIFARRRAGAVGRTAR